MNHSRQCLILVALTVSISGFLLGFHPLGIASTMPFIKDYFDSTVLMAGAVVGFVLIGIPATKASPLRSAMVLSSVND